MIEPFDLEPEHIDRSAPVGRDIFSLAENARSEVLNFRSAIALIDASFSQIEELRSEIHKDWVNAPNNLRRDEKIIRYWPRIGAHSAISTLYQFQDTLNAIVEFIKENPDDVRHVTDAETANKALVKFNRTFPKWEQTRHATAHSSEIRRDFRKNSHKGKLSRGVISKPKGVMVMISDSFVNRIFTTTRKGEILEFDTTWKSYLELVDIYNLAISGLSLWVGPRPADDG